MTAINLKLETYLLNEETARLFGVYQKTRRIARGIARKAGEAREAWEAREAREAWKAYKELESLEAHCEKAHGLSHNQTWSLYLYWMGRQ